MSKFSILIFFLALIRSFTALAHTIMIDLDKTLGYQLEAKKEWILYDGAVTDFIKPLHQDGHKLVILTVNLKENVQRLFEQYPILKNYISEIITAEDLSPSFADLMQNLKPLITTDVSGEEWQKLVFQVWKTNPKRYSPPNTPLEHMPKTFEEWRSELYFPYLRPDKSQKVLEYDAILFDDIFSYENLVGAYMRLKKEMRGFFIGQPGGEDPSLGPDFKEVYRWIKLRLCGKAMDSKE